MRSSPDEFLLFSSQAKASSKLLRVVGHSIAKMSWIVIEGRISTATLDSFRVTGRGCELILDLEGAEFDFASPEEIAVNRDSAHLPFAEMWEVRFLDGGKILVAEMREPVDKSKPQP